MTDSTLNHVAFLMALHSGKTLGVLQVVRAAHEYGTIGYEMTERLIGRDIDHLVGTRPINEILDSRSQPETVASTPGAATEAHTAQISPRAEVEAIQADTRRIAEIREEMEADFADSPDPEAFYDRRGRRIAEDPDADYDAECKYAEVD